MPLFQRLFGRKRFRRFADSFTLSDGKKTSTLCQWVGRQTAKGKTVIVLSHFESTFLQNQVALQEAGFEFEILANSLDPHAFVERWSGVKHTVILTMAQMLQLDEHHRQLSGKLSDQSFSVIVTERYPVTANDEKLEQFFSGCNAEVEMGYLISFEDPILGHLLGERFIGLLKQLGLGSHDLVSSTMTHRALSRQLARATASITQEIQAESPQEWIRLNLEN